jgi:ribosomal protein S18 acetylase RimI-like enzyme
MDFSIREIAKDELHKIAQLSQEIWPISYKEIITEAQISYMLQWMYSERTLQENLVDGHRFFLAETTEKPLGFVGFQCINGEHKFTKLHKLYVLPNLHHQGIGKALSACVIEESKKCEAQYILLQVNKKNPAIHFYKKQAFYIHEEAIFDIGNGFVMDDYLMKLDL